MDCFAWYVTIQIKPYDMLNHFHENNFDARRFKCTKVQWNCIVEKAAVIERSQNYWRSANLAHSIVKELPTPKWHSNKYQVNWQTKKLNQVSYVCVRIVDLVVNKSDAALKFKFKCCAYSGDRFVISLTKLISVFS